VDRALARDEAMSDLQALIMEGDDRFRSVPRPLDTQMVGHALLRRRHPEPRPYLVINLNAVDEILDYEPLF